MEKITIQNEREEVFFAVGMAFEKIKREFFDRFDCICQLTCDPFFNNENKEYFLIFRFTIHPGAAIDLDDIDSDITECLKFFSDGKVVLKWPLGTGSNENEENDEDREEDN